MREWLALYNTPGIGPLRFFRLIKRFLDPGQILQLSRENPHLLQHDFGFNDVIITALKNPDWKLVDQQCEWATQPHHYLITLHDSAYPLLLREIPDPPPVLFVQGDLGCLNQPQLAMVGSRNPSPNGLETAYHFAYALSQCGMLITSGLALGIDGMSHRGALDAQGKTIAVLGSGLNFIYPAFHKNLAKQIIEQGVLISEFTPEARACASHFPQRNRLISGLSLGTLVVEASPRSGSLITARLAVEQGREVFAIPGSIHHPLSKGCHLLIQQGAKLVTTIEEIIEEISGVLLLGKTPTKNDRFANSLDLKTGKLLECVGFEITSIDQIVYRSGYPIQQVMALLCQLELEKYIQTVRGGYIRIYPLNCVVGHGNRIKG